MSEQKTARPRPRKVRGTAVFHGDDSMEFVPQQEGQPVQKSVRKLGESRFYETEGEKQSSYVAHLKVDKSSADPAAEMFEQLALLAKPLMKQQPPMPRSKVLLDDTNIHVWHEKADNKVVIMMEVDTTASGELSSQVYNLTIRVHKCFAINETSLRPPKK